MPDGTRRGFLKGLAILPFAAVPVTKAAGSILTKGALSGAAVAEAEWVDPCDGLEAAEFIEPSKITEILDPVLYAKDALRQLEQALPTSNLREILVPATVRAKLPPPVDPTSYSKWLLTVNNRDVPVRWAAVKFGGKPTDAWTMRRDRGLASDLRRPGRVMLETEVDPKVWYGLLCGMNMPCGLKVRSGEKTWEIPDAILLRHNVREMASKAGTEDIGHELVFAANECITNGERVSKDLIEKHVEREIVEALSRAGGRVGLLFPILKKQVSINKDEEGNIRVFVVAPEDGSELTLDEHLERLRNDPEYSRWPFDRGDA